MEFALVGGVMLAIVLLYYMKMIGKRADLRMGSDEIDGILSKVAIFESVAKDKDALNLIQESLKLHPGNVRLTQKESAITARLRQH